MKKYELSEREKGVILGIILNTRNDYLKKHKYVKIQCVELDDAKIITTEKEIEKLVDKLCNKIMSATELGNLFENKNIKDIVERALTLKQKSVLFSYYYEGKRDKQLGKELKIKEDTIRKMRNRAIDKIRKIIKEEKRWARNYLEITIWQMKRHLIL